MVSGPVLRVLKPGLLSTLQDLGRTGYQRLGVSPCGAMDAFALRLANRLVGNPEGSVGVEITLAGIELELMQDCEVALAGADLVLTGEGAFDATSVAGKAVGEVVRRAQAARRKVAVVAATARDVVGVHVVDGGGRRLGPADVAALAERATRDAFGLPVP